MDCPRCGFNARAKLTFDKAAFFLYRCPSCNSNVVMYDNKVDILSDGLVNLLMGQKKMRFCGTVEQHKELGHGSAITADDLINLKILLNTETDVNKIIAKL